MPGCLLYGSRRVEQSAVELDVVCTSDWRTSFNLKFANFVKFEFEFEFVCEPPKLEVCKLEVCKLEVWEFPNSNLKFEFVRQPPKLKQTQT